MGHAILPLNFYCRNARLCHKKAISSRNSQLFQDELSHLHNFQTLVTSTIPSHPQFQDKKSDKQIAELLLCLSDAQKRIRELELEECHQSHKLLGPHTISLKKNVAKTSSKSYKSAKSRSSKPTLHTWSPRSTHSVLDVKNIVSESLGSQIRQKSPQRSMRLGPSSSSSKSAKKMAVNSSPTKKQQTWAIWTANPHDISGNDSNSGLSPPSKRHIRSSPLVHEFKASPPPDPRAEAILGGCALLATHLQSFDERNNSKDQGQSRSPSSRRGEREKMPNNTEWCLSQHSKVRERVDYVEIPDGDQDETASSHKSSMRGSRFRYATDFFEKKLQEKISKKAHHSVSEQETKLSSSLKARISSERKHEKAKNNQEKVHSVLSRSFSPSSHNARLQRLSNEESNSIDLDQESNDTWAREVVPAIEQKLTHEMLRSHSATQIHDSKRKKHKPRGILGMMDNVIRQAVDSDSECLSNITLPRNISLAETSSKCAHPLTSGNIQTKHSSTKQPEGQQPLFQGLQVEALEKKITSLQSLVGDLKESIEGFTSRVEEDGDSWQNRMQGLEKQMKVLRDDTDQVFLCIKGTIKDEIKSKLEDVTKGLDRAEERLAEMDTKKKGSEQRLESRIQDCSTTVDSLRRQMDSMVSDVKVNIMRDMKERIYQSVQALKVGVKNDMDILELGMYEDIENMRKDLDAKLESTYVECEKAKKSDNQQIELLMEEKISQKFAQNMNTIGVEIPEKTVSQLKSELKAESERLRKAERQEMEDLIEEKIHKKLLEPMDVLFGDKEKVMANMENQIRLLWAEVELLSKGRDMIKYSVEELTQIAEHAKETINKEQALLKTENASLKKQLQYFKKETMQTRADIEDFKRDMEHDMKDLKLTVGKMKDEGENMEESMNFLNKEQDILKKVVEKIKDEIKKKNNKAESVGLRTDRDEDEMGTDSSDRMLIIERIETLSALYLKGLEEIRQEITTTKHACNDRIKKLENQCMGRISEQQEQDQFNMKSKHPLEELVLDGLETRISHLEHTLEHNHNFKEQRENVESVMVAVHKDREQVAAVLLQVEAASKRAESTVAETCNTMQKELESMRIHSLSVQEELSSYKDKAAAAVSEVMEIREHIGKEKESLISHAEAKKQEAEIAVGEILKAQRKSVALSEDMKTSLVHEVSKVRSHAEVIEEQRNKTINHIEEWKKMMADDVNKARIALDGIEKEKRKSISLLETVAFKEKEELEQHVQQMEGSLHSLMNLVQQARCNLDVKLEDMNRKQAELEEQDKQIKSEIEDVKDKMKNAFDRIDTLDSSTIELQSKHAELEKSSDVWSHKYDAACQVFQEIENRLSSLENVSRENDIRGGNTEHQITSSEKQRLVNLYKELSGFLRNMRDRQDGDTTEWPEDEVEQKFHTLETRIQQIESEFQSSLRSLESKTLELSMTTQTALEGASLAEEKCGNLGVELVKVCRMIASSGKGSPTKATLMMNDMSTADEGPSTRSIHRSLHPNTPANNIKAKGGLSSTTTANTNALFPCSFCKSAAMKGSNIDPRNNHHRTHNMESCSILHNKDTADFKIHDRSGNHVDNPHPDTFQIYSKNGKMEGKRVEVHHHYEGKLNNERTGHAEVSPSKDRTIHGAHDNTNRVLQHQHEEDGNIGNSRSSPTRRNQNQQKFERSEDFGALLNVGKGGSDGSGIKVYSEDGRQNPNVIAANHHVKGNTNNVVTSTTTTHHHQQLHKHSAGTSSGKNCQSTNIRLEAGKIQVNVSHRSAVPSSGGGNSGGGRIMPKRGRDASP